LRFNSTSLALEGRSSFPTPPGPLAASPAGLWVGVATHLYLVDPSTDTILRRIGVRGTIGQIAVDPSGEHLYVATRIESQDVAGLLSERDTRTGSLIRLAPPSA